MMAALINRAGGWLTNKPNYLTDEAAGKLSARKRSQLLATCGLPSKGQVAEARTYLAIKAKHEVCEVKCSTNT